MKLNSKLKICFALVFGAIVLAGCGQKGPLYLPDDPERTQKEHLDDYYKRY